jgi:signal transduction histidine kinase
VFDLKTFSRADKGELAKVDINVIIEGVLRIVWNEIKYKAELHREFGELPLVDGNAQQLGQVFLNMFVNASQAIEEQGQIYVRTFVRENNIAIEIEDNGKGMTQDVLLRIFDPFFTTKDPGEGTGLGLSVSYDIINWHGGSIGVESEVGKGTKFTILLPVQKVDGV